MKKDIGVSFPDHSKLIKINDSNIYYVDAGEGDPILFLHGVPTSSYLWRNIIPELTHVARCIAPDLIGFGHSDKPNIKYSIVEYFDYLNRFIELLDLKKITLVMHGLGSVIGLYYAACNPHRIKGIAFYEAHLHPITERHKLSLPLQQLISLMDSRDRIYKAIINDNYLMKKIFPASMLHKLNAETFNQYNEPFKLAAHRLPLLQYVYELFLPETNTNAANFINTYVKFLRASSIPKLMLYSVPGFFTTIDTVRWCKDNFPYLDLVDLGEELHFAQENDPSFFADSIMYWYEKITCNNSEYLQFINKNLYNHT